MKHPAPSEHDQQEPRPRTWMAVLLLVGATLLCFANALTNDFTNWDDPLYVTSNDLIQNFTSNSFREVFTSFLVGNYHPLTVLSFALDFKIYQLDPFGFHLTNIIIHIFNVLLVFIFIRRLSGSARTAFLTAIIFGIHPLRVESVAWVSERKDVLYTCFYLSALHLYALFTSSASRTRAYWYYSGALCLFLFSLLSKGQAVTLPIILVLIDYVQHRHVTTTRILEKLPFFILAVLFGLLAVHAQKDTGAIAEVLEHSLPVRLLFAGSNLCRYVAKFILPVNLSAFYPYPLLTDWSSYLSYLIETGLAASVVFAGIFAWIAHARHTHSTDLAANAVSSRIPPNRRLMALMADRAVVFGALFFLVNIALLLQILPVGSSILAERYTYVSSIGLSFLVAHAFSQLWSSRREDLLLYKRGATVVLTMYCLWLGYATIERNKVWRGSEALWTDVLGQFPQAVMAYLNRGSFYQLANLPDLALADFDAGLAVKPLHWDILVNRCDVHRMLGRFDESIADCTKVIDHNGKVSAAYTNRGITYSIIHRYDEALADFEKALTLEPQSAKLYTNRGNVRDMMGMFDAAIQDYTHAISLKPDYYAAYFNRGNTKLKKGQVVEALSDLNTALKSDELRTRTYYTRAQAYKALGDYRQALADVRAAQRLGLVVDLAKVRDIEVAAAEQK